MMPRKDGFTLAREIREKNPQVPIIFLTAKTMKEDMLAGFKVGADDYITKPFDSEVLLYKLKAILKRSNEKGMITPSGNSPWANTSSITIIAPSSRAKNLKTVSKGGRFVADAVHLQNELLPRQKALKEIWGDDNYFNARSMDVFITKLRKYLRDDPTLDIINIHGKGFRLVDNVQKP